MNFASNVFRRSVAFGLIGFMLCVAASAQVSVLTERYDKSRTGANLAETQLTTSNVNVNSFGKLWSYPVSGSVFAQPLYVPGVTIPGKGVKNVLYVETMNDVVYAFDADSNSATPLWSLDLTTQVAGSTPVPIVDIVQDNTLNIVGNIGIESTPVIDPATNTIYLVARTKESGRYFQRLHAVDTTTGSEKLGGPTVIQGSVPGTGDGSNAGTLTFDPRIENQRSSLALANGQIYMSWASHEDLNAYHGWVMSYSASTLQQTGIWCSTPNGYEGGIWMAGWAPAVDAAGNVYYLSGNGTWDTKDFGESILKFGPAQGLPLVDWFTPDDWATLNGGDIDMGSFGPLLVPGTDLIMGGGKTAIFYVAHTGSLGHEQTGNGQIVQSLNNNSDEIKGGPVYWNRSGGVGPWLYIWASNDVLKAYHFNGSTFDTAVMSQSTFAAPGGASGGVLTLSANGSATGSGIIWSSMPLNTDGDHGIHPGVLRAFNADDLTKELWNSTLNLARDDSGNWPKYSAPTVVNGRVYMGAFPADGIGPTNVSVYGLLTATPVVATPTFSPAPGSYTSAQSVTLADTTAGATIYYTTDGSTPTTSSAIYSAAITVSATTTIEAIAAASGQTTSGVATGTYVISSSVATPTFSPAPGSYTSAQSVTIADSTAGATIYYTTNGSTPTTSSAIYSAAITVSATTTIKAIAAASGKTNSGVATGAYVIGSSGPGTLIPQQGWSLQYVDSQETTGEYAPATNAFDGIPSTFWHTQWAGANPPPPHEVQIKLGGSYSIGGFSYLPRQGGCTNGYVGQYEFYVSTDGVNWGTPQASGTFDYGAGFHYGCDGTGTPTTARVILFAPVTGSYIRFRALSEVGGNPWTSAAELNVYNGNGQPATPVPSSVALNPSTVTGGTSSTGTVTLTAAAPTGGTVVTLTSNSAVATVPASVTVAAGQTSASFTVATVAGSSGTATISASANGTTASGTLTVQLPAPVPSSLTLNPSTVTGGTSSTGTVTLTAAAPTGGTVVTLSSNIVAATVPTSVTVAAGQTSASFTVGTVSGSNATATISASANGTTVSKVLTIQLPAPVPSVLTLNPTTVTGGTSSTGTVTLTAAAPTGGTVVTLSSNNAAATVPASVTVAAGQTSASFTVATVSGSSATATISASANGTTVSGTLTVQPPAPVPSVLTLNPSTVTGGASSTGTVTLTSAAPSGGITVTLSSNNAAATVPASAAVAAGQTSASFTVATVSGSNATATISASANGTTISKPLTIQSGVVPVPSSLTLSPSAVIGGASSTGTVTLTAAAPTGGTVVALSSNSAAATVPANVTVVAGQTKATFTIKTVSGASATATIFASANGTTVSSTLVVQSYISQAVWTLKYVDSQETQAENGAAINAFDGNSLSKWHTQWSTANPPPPHEIQINLGASYTLNGFAYLPRQDGCSNGTVSQYEFYVSTDGVNWGTAVSTGTFNYGTANLGCGGLPRLPQQVISFPAKTGQYIRFRALREVNGQPWTSAAEINVLR